MWCCAGDERFVALRRRPSGEASNHLMLRWLKTVVVSEEEKAHVMRQVAIRKASVSEPLSTCRNDKSASKPGRRMVLARRCRHLAGHSRSGRARDTPGRDQEVKFAAEPPGERALAKDCPADQGAVVADVDRPGKPREVAGCEFSCVDGVGEQGADLPEHPVRVPQDV